MGYALLTLDTHAPVVTWGSPQGAVPGSLLAVPYTVDEPGVVSARLTDFDGVTYDMTVETDRLTVALPQTAALGQATIEAVVEDDVLNTTTRTLVLAINSARVPEVGGGRVVPGVPREVPPLRTKRTVRSVSRARATTGSRVLAAAIVRSTVEPTVSSRVSAYGTIECRTRVAPTRHAVTTRVEVQTAVTVSTTPGAVHRDETQIALLALLLTD